MHIFKRLKNLWELGNFEPSWEVIEGKPKVTLKFSQNTKKQLAKIVNIPKADVMNEPIKSDES